MTEGDLGFWGRRARANVFSTQLRQYVVAVLSVAAALTTTLLLGSYLEPTPTPLFFVAVMVSAWYGGLKPGIVSTILSTLAINYFLLESRYGFTIPSVGTLVRLGVFVMAALLINSLNEAQRTARQRAEVNFRSLRESEARFGCLAESNIIGMLVADLEGVILEANQNFLELVGYTPDELRAGRLDWRKMTPPECMEDSERAVQELLTTGACTPFEKQYIRKDGSRVFVLHGAVLTGKNTVTGFVLDLSERKRTEAIQQEAMRRERSLHGEVQTANAQLETVLASLKDQFFVLDREWRYVYVSDRVVKVVGKDKSVLLGKCIWDVFPEIVNSQFYKEVHRALAEQEIVQFEYFYTPWQQWFENRVYPSASGVSVLVTDVTERKQAEAKLQRTNQTLQTLLDNCPVAIAFFDPHGIVRLWNRAAERIFGWSADETIGQFMPTVPHRQQEFLASLASVLSGQSLNGFEAQHQRKDGRMVDLEIWATLTHDEDGNPGCLCIGWDITERKLAEEALRKSEEQYRAIYDQVLVGIAQADITGKIIKANERFCEIVGRSQEELLTLHMQEITHPDDLPRNVELFQQMVRNGTTFEIEKRYVRADGSDVWVQNFVSLIHDADGRHQCAVAVTVDITGKKQAEANLRDSEERLRLALSAANQGLYDHNVQTGNAIVSPAYAEMLGYNPNEFKETNATWRASLHPDDVDRVYQTYRDYISGKLDIYRVEYRQRTQSGGWKWILSVGKIVSWDKDGKPLRMLGTHTDISDRKQIEEALRNSAEQLSLALMASNLGDWHWDAATDVVTLSEQAAEMFGIPPGPYMTWTQMQELLHPNDREHARSQVEHAIANQSAYDVEYRVIYPDTTERWIAAKGRAQYDSSGQVLRMLGVVQDISHRKQAETVRLRLAQEREQLLAREKAARQDAETANRIKDEFLAVLSHELRSPLNPILGWAKLLQTQRLDEQKTQMALTTIERNAKLQTQLIEDLLDVSRILRGKLVLNIAPVSLTNTIEAALETVRLAVESKDIQLQKLFTLESDQVMGDAARLQQVVWNLLTNAVKFTPPGGRIDIQLSLVMDYVASIDRAQAPLDSSEQQIDDRKQRVRYAQIKVTDTGKGINPEFLPYVFDYFRQEDGTTTRKFGGLGLGLAIVRHITELHGGSVWAESEGEGLGATFTVQMPLMPISVDMDARDETLAVANLSGARVLAVDDDEDIRTLIEFILQHAGAEVQVVASATEALQHLDAFSPDILISDIGMPGFDGYMLIRQIRTLESDLSKIPAIALTAYAGEIDQQQAIAAGFQMHLPKPVEPEKLINAIARFIEQGDAEAR